MKNVKLEVSCRKIQNSSSSISIGYIVESRVEFKGQVVSDKEEAKLTVALAIVGSEKQIKTLMKAINVERLDEKTILQLHKNTAPRQTTLDEE